MSKSFTRSVFTISTLTLLSRVFGYVRDILIARVLGASVLADLFFVAFRLPNFFRQLSAEGAFHNGFVPLFSQTLEQDGKAPALRFASQTCSWMLLVLIVFTLIIELAMPLVMMVLAPGFLDDPKHFALLVSFSRITFPYLLCVSLVALLGAMLNSSGRFFAFASAPLILNLCLISALLGHSFFSASAAHALSMGVLLAGLLQLGWLLFHCRRAQMVVTLERPQKSQKMSLLFRRMIPGILSGSVMQCNVLINTILATFIPGAVSYLYYADRLVQLPLALIGTAIGTALLPLLSKYAQQKDHSKITQTQNHALSLNMMFILPASVGLLIIASPLISVMFERGAFDAQATQATANALRIYALGLPAFALAKIFLPSFYSRGDTKTPLYIALICLTVNVSCGIGTFWWLGHLGLALATTLSSWCQFTLLTVILSRRGWFGFSSQCRQYVRGFAAASLVMSLCVGASIHLFWPAERPDLLTSTLLIGFFILAGAASFFAFLHLSRLMRFNEMRQLLVR